MSAARPRIGLTTSWVAGSEGKEPPHAVMYRVYIDALEAVGLAPLLLTPAHSAASVAALLDVCDGLVLSGGGDIEAWRFGEEPHPSLSWVVPERDAMEWSALDVAGAAHMPVLGICRGCQVVNVHRGGTLFQDLPTQRPGVSAHQQTQAWSERTHEVRVQPGSLLHEAVGLDRFMTNSFHHQGVDAVASSLEPIAWSEDGLVEAFQSRDGGWLLGVQWHPERLPAGSDEADPDRKLFAAFAAAVRDRRAGGRTAR